MNVDEKTKNAPKATTNMRSRPGCASSSMKPACGDSILRFGFSAGSERKAAIVAVINKTDALTNA